MTPQAVECAAFKKEYQGDAEDVILRILQEWLEGKGLPVSWETLVKTLRDTGLPALADTIHDTKNVVITSSHSHSHLYDNVLAISPCVMRTAYVALHTM